MKRITLNPKTIYKNIKRIKKQEKLKSHLDYIFSREQWELLDVIYLLTKVSRKELLLNYNFGERELDFIANEAMKYVLEHNEKGGLFEVAGYPVYIRWDGKETYWR